MDVYFDLWWETAGADEVSKMLCQPEMEKIFIPKDPKKFAELMEKICCHVWKQATVE